MAKKDPTEVVHVMPKPGETVTWGEKSFGDRATIQLRRDQLDQLKGDVEEVDPANLPDVATRVEARQPGTA